MMPDPIQAQQELREQNRVIDEMIEKIKAATRMMDLATHEIHKRDARIADLEIECERLRGQLASYGRRLDAALDESDRRKDALETLRKRTRAQAETIRRMEEGEL